MKNWNEMQPELFGADGPATLFDASTLAHGADKCGTPDMFAAAEAEAAEAEGITAAEAEMVARLERKGYTRGEITAAIAYLVTSFGDDIAAGNADGLIREHIDTHAATRALKVTDPAEGREYIHDYESAEIARRAAKRLRREGWTVAWL